MDGDFVDEDENVNNEDDGEDDGEDDSGDDVEDGGDDDTEDGTDEIAENKTTGHAHSHPQKTDKYDLSRIDLNHVDNHESSHVPQSALCQKLVFEELELNDRQKFALHKIIQGENVFITGVSGTGKSEMIHTIARVLRGMGDKVAITSANLVGAISINGQTIQSFCGLKKLDDTWENIKKEVQFKYVQTIWNSINVLIIDDINMMSPYDFRKILYTAQTTRSAKNPIQWVLLGDFLGLPPPGTNPHKDNGGEKEDLEFCFQLPEWSKLIHTTVYLTDNFVQSKHDPEFQTIVENIRTGASNQVKWIAKFQQRQDQPFDASTPFTKLYPKYDAVNAENEVNFKRLSTPEYKFTSQKGYQIGNQVCPLHVPKSRRHLDKDVLQVVEKLSLNEHKRTRLLNFLQKHAVVDPVLTLKKGAVVILMANLNYKHGLVRGAQGVITGFIFTDKNVPRYPVVRFATCECVVKSYMWSVDYSEGTKLWYSQIPLKLGWAYSIHRLRGMVFDRVELSMKDMFEFGQVYDVLSKLKSLSGINFTTISWSAIKAHPLSVEYYEKNMETWTDEFLKWKRSGKPVEYTNYSAKDNIPQTAFHMDALSNLRETQQQKHASHTNTQSNPSAHTTAHTHGAGCEDHCMDEDVSVSSSKRRKTIIDDDENEDMEESDSRAE
jgi:ABC-type oligopeptide transport system ATPase subunit